MAAWRVEVDGPLRITVDGMPFRPRTRHQGLLLARLAAHGERGIDRFETAALLWPEAERNLQAAYLRRALMELRRAGFEIESRDGRLWPLRPVELLCLGDGSAILESVEHPIAREIRALLPRRVAPKAIARTDADRLMIWIGETLVARHPEVALDILAQNGADLLRTSPPAPLLALLLRTLSTSERLDIRRVIVVRFAAVAAMYLTKYGLAERLLRQAVEDARTLGEDALAAYALSNLSFLLMETRRWTQALETGQLAVEAAHKSRDRAALASCLNNFAGVQWHALRFDEAMANYVSAYEIALSDNTRQMALGNAVLVAGVYGILLPMAVEPPQGDCASTGAMIFTETNLRLGYGLLHGEMRSAVEGVARLLRITSAGGMERHFCVALDYAAYLFASSGHQAAAACLRIGSRHRRAVGHVRSPAENLAIRRHVAPPYFGREVAASVAEITADDPLVCAERIAGRLEALLVGRFTENMPRMRLVD